MSTDKRWGKEEWSICVKCGHKVKPDMGRVSHAGRRVHESCAAMSPFAFLKWRPVNEANR